jgi:leucyl/phenylalanyl-tRNA--protein transferase
MADVPSGDFVHFRETGLILKEEGLMSLVPVPPPFGSVVPARVVLGRYARGYISSLPDPVTGRVRWCRTSHRGVQRLDEIRIPRKQRPYVFSKRFEIRYNTAFESVVRYCADPTRDPEGKTWILGGLIEGLVELHRRGFAYSFEAWEQGELVGGGFGMTIGAFISVDSMFHRTDNAGKAGYVQMLLGLRERGFEMVDLNEPTPVVARFGAKWEPVWRFDAMQREAMGREATFLDGRASPRLPRGLRVALMVRRARMSVARKLGLEMKWPQTKPVSAEAVRTLAPVELPLDPRVDVDVLLDPSSIGRSVAAAVAAGKSLPNESSTV